MPQGSFPQIPYRVFISTSATGNTNRIELFRGERAIQEQDSSALVKVVGNELWHFSTSPLSNPLSSGPLRGLTGIVFLFYGPSYSSNFYL